MPENATIQGLKVIILNIADGCHLNRKISDLVRQQFPNVTTEQFYAPKLPKVVGYMYQGIAVK